MPAAANPLQAARDARRAAARADPALGWLIDKIWAETLAAIDHQPVGRRDEMLRRVRILFQILTDRRGWPDRML